MAASDCHPPLGPTAVAFVAMVVTTLIGVKVGADERPSVRGDTSNLLRTEIRFASRRVTSCFCGGSHRGPPDINGE
jgi:hypothetical protein